MDMKTYKTLIEFISHFKDEASCRKYFEQVRFANGDYCPHCKHDKIMRFSDGMRYRCQKCKQDFTIKTGTLFGESKIPLQKWFIAIYLLTTSKKGISSIELAQHVGVTQKTAWFMDHRIREAMKQGKGKLLGVVEVDETYVGGHHNQKKYGFSKKAAVMGMTERGGKVRAMQIPNRETHIILNALTKNVDKRAYLMSDDAGVYRKVVKLGYQHGSVKHGKRHWVRGNVHTNSIESFWALFKRNYHGTYHSMSKKHLQRYIDEIVFRFNNRKLSMKELFDEVTNRASNRGIMSYAALTA